MDDAWVRGFLKHQMLREAVASVSLSHDPRCSCTTCRAAGGDEEAFIEILSQYELREPLPGPGEPEIIE